MKKTNPTAKVEKPTVKKKTKFTGAQILKQDTERKKSIDQAKKILPLRPYVKEFLGVSDQQKDQHFAQLLKGLFRVVMAESPSTVFLRNNRRFNIQEIFKFVVEQNLFGQFKSDERGNILHQENKLQFDDVLGGYLRKAEQTMEQCFQVHDYSSFQICRKNVLFSIRGVHLALEKSITNMLKLTWELIDIIELPSSQNNLSKKINRRKKSSITKSSSMSLPRLNSKALRDIQESHRLFGLSNTQDLSKRIFQIQNHRDSKEDVKVHLPSPNTPLLDFQIALAQIIPSKLPSGRRKKKLPTADAIVDRKAILLDFLKSTSDFELYWTARPENHEPESSGSIAYLAIELTPSPENLAEFWEANGMPFRVFSALQEKLPAWWFKNKRAIRRQSAASKRTTRRATRSVKKAPQSG